MNCSKTRLKLLDFIDGNLDQKNTANVEKHLSGCDVCRGFFTELQQFNILMHTEKKPNVNPFLSNRIVETMVLQSDTPSQLHRRHFSKLTAAAAIAVLVVAGIFGGLEI